MHPLDGARERLKRADQSIGNLNGEVIDFLAPAPIAKFDVDIATKKPLLTDEYREMHERVREFIQQTTVPLRLKMLTGEIIHHLRCAFDHLAWQLSSAKLQADSPNQIEFPVFDKEPELCRITQSSGITKIKISRYCRKVQGIASPTALARIHSLQPYLRGEPRRDPLWLIHDMDRIDKHRELIVVPCIGQLNITANSEIPALAYTVPWEIKPRRVQVTGPAKVQMKGEMRAQIALGEFAKREDQPLIPTLQNLLSFTINSVESFAPEFS